MPTDRHGVTHAGSLGLFDDDDEYDAAIRRAERHGREKLAHEMRRQERYAAREHRQALKAARRETKPPPRLPGPFAWLGKLFGGKKNGESIASQEKRKDEKRPDVPRPFEHPREIPPSGFVVVRRQSTPERVYTWDDVDLIDGPFYEEGGLVRVKTNDVGGCRIVPRSSIQASK